MSETIFLSLALLGQSSALCVRACVRAALERVFVRRHVGFKCFWPTFWVFGRAFDVKTVGFMI